MLAVRQSLIPNGTVQMECKNTCTSEVTPSVDQCVSARPSAAVWISLTCVLAAALSLLGICNIVTLCFCLWKKKNFLKSK